ncbi:DUF4386 family protein [Dactylosporangium sp. NPDC048998]|uniref:DUF4386 family protein n=1 Tax=Dactylosporangium sp. NPDC048998 TaxID=3363976 RepID=UPI003711A782
MSALRPRTNPPDSSPARGAHARGKVGAMVDRASLRLSATLLLAGQLLFIVVTHFHTGGPANNHPEVFAGYAGSQAWTAVHIGQFAAMAILLAGLLALFSALNARAGAARWASRFGAASAVAALALYAILQAVDGVALKHAVDAWAGAPDAEKPARFASAEAIRWLEWGMRSYQDFALGLALLLLAAAVVRAKGIPRPIAYLMGLSGLTYLAQGWVAGSEGFTSTQTILIVLAFVLDLAWMIWLVAVAWRMQDPDVQFTE